MTPAISLKPADDTPMEPPYHASVYCPEDSLGYLMRHITLLVANEVGRQLAHTGMTNAQWIPIYKIYRGDASTAAQLARECHMDNGAMTRTLDRLEAKGLCKRVRSEVDRRVVHIELTEAGRQAASTIPDILCGVQNACLKDFTRQEFESVRAHLRRILTNAENLAPHA